MYLLYLEKNKTIDDNKVIEVDSISKSLLVFWRIWELLIVEDYNIKVMI